MSILEPNIKAHRTVESISNLLVKHKSSSRSFLTPMNAE